MFREIDKKNIFIIFGLSKVSNGLQLHGILFQLKNECETKIYISTETWLIFKIALQFICQLLYNSILNFIRCCLY